MAMALYDLQVVILLSVSSFKFFNLISKRSWIELAQIFFSLKANGKGLIIGFEIFGFGHSKPELWLVQKRGICVTFFNFWEKYWFLGFCQPIGKKLDVYL